MSYTIGSFCTGFGGLDLAVEAVLGPADHLWHAEFNQEKAKILAAHWPSVPNLGDITAVDWATVPRPDVVTAGFPCTDISAAGRRAGLGAGTRSGVWGNIATALAVLRPRLVLIENVRALLSTDAQRNTDGPDCDVESGPAGVGDGSDGSVLRAAGAVLGDLADLGFDAEWTTVAASDVGACHRRERVFILAWPADSEGVGHWHRRAQGRPRVPAAAVAGGVGADGVSPLLPTPRARDFKGQSGEGFNDGNLPQAVALLPTPRATDGTKGGPNQRGSSGDLMLPSAVMQLLPTSVTTDANGARNATANRSAPKPTTSTSGWTLSDVAYADRWGQYAPAIARWEQVTGRPAPEPAEPGAKGQPRLSPRFVEWMQGLPEGWVTDHVGRNPALHALGDGVVWQQGAHALRLLLASAATPVGVAA